MLEPKKPTDDSQSGGSEKPAKQYNPTPVEDTEGYEPGTLDPNNPDKE